MMLAAKGRGELFGQVVKVGRYPNLSSPGARYPGRVDFCEMGRASQQVSQPGQSRSPHHWPPVLQDVPTARLPVTAARVVAAALD